MPQFSEIIEPSRSLLTDNCRLKVTGVENKTTLLPSCLHSTKVSTVLPSLDNNLITSSFMTQLSDLTT